MKRTIAIIILLLVSVVWAVDSKWSDKLATHTATDMNPADMFLTLADPNGTPLSRMVGRTEALADWPGSTGITTLGTITTGVWNAGAVTSSGVIGGTDLTASGDIIGQDDLQLDSDAALFQLGEDQDVVLTHVADTGVLLTGTTDNQLQIGDSGTFLNQSIDGTLNIAGDTLVEITTPNLRLEVDDAAYLNIATADGGITTISQTSDGADEIKLGDGGDLVSVDSGNWDVSNAGAFTGVTGITSTGVLDFGGATSTEIVNATDPDVDASGEISHDTDGANETGDETLRGYDGAAQFLWASKIKYINVTLISPDTIDAVDLIPIWHNTSGMTFTVLEWKAWSDDDDVSLEIEELTDQTDYTARTTVDAVEIATDGTGVYYASDSTITHAAIEHDHSLAIDFDATDTPDYVQIIISGYCNSDVD